jgi:hypothetical protein
MPWLDKENYFIDYVSRQMEFPPVTETTGVFNETTVSAQTSIEQATPKTKETSLLKPLKIKSTPPTRKSYKHGE